MMGEAWRTDANHIAVNPRCPEAAAGLDAFAQRQGWRGMCFFQTSGSEGTPKWVGLTKEALLVSAREVNGHFEVVADDHWLVALPLHHVGGFAIQARAFLSGSRVTQCLAKWNPPAFAALCEEEGITLTSLVPTQIHDLVQARVTCPDRMRAVIVGGGGMSQALADAAAELGWPVFQTYGMTEAASQIAAQPYNSFGALFDVQSLEVLPHWDLETDADSRLILRGPALAKGYARRDEPHGTWSWEPIDPVAGLRTRDQVKLWVHGTRRFLSFVGRESGQIKILGELVHLAPLQERIETIARELGWAALPVIVALPDPRRETKLVLVMEPGQGKADALIARYEEQTPPFCHFSGVEVVPVIPKTALGKVEMPELLRLVQQDS